MQVRCSCWWALRTPYSRYPSSDIGARRLLASLEVATGCPTSRFVLCVFFFVRSGATLVQWTVHSSDGPVSNQPWAEFVHNHMVKGQPSLLKFKVKGAFFTSWGIWSYGAIPVVLDQLLFHECCGHYHASHIYFLDNFRLDQPEFPGKWKKSQTL